MTELPERTRGNCLVFVLSLKEGSVMAQQREARLMPLRNVERGGDGRISWFQIEKIVRIPTVRLARLHGLNQMSLQRCWNARLTECLDSFGDDLILHSKLTAVIGEEIDELQRDSRFLSI